MTSEELQRAYDLTLRPLTQEAAISTTLGRRRGLEQQHGLAYQALVRAGLARPLRKRYRV